jgi:hypothetical protein
MEMSDISTLLQSRHYRFALTRSVFTIDSIPPDADNGVHRCPACRGIPFYDSG